jgi:hypothetical protein
MQNQDFTITILVDQSPSEVFNAVNNPRGWWSEEIEGHTDKLNHEFSYHFEDIHRCRLKLIELIPDQVVVWHVLDNYFKPGIFNNASHEVPATEFSNGKNEWKNTEIVFEISSNQNKTQLRFTHSGLNPEYECFEVCSNAWTHYIRQSLFELITTGKGQPNSTGTPMTADEEKIRTATSQN